MNLFELANLFHTLLLQQLAGPAQVLGVNFTIVLSFQMHRSSRPLQLTGLRFYFCRCLKLHAGAKNKYSVYLCHLHFDISWATEIRLCGRFYIFPLFYNINDTCTLPCFLPPAVMHIHPESFECWNLDTCTSHPTSAIFPEFQAID